jgi:hypothetical protein
VKNTYAKIDCHLTSYTADFTQWFPNAYASSPYNQWKFLPFQHFPESLALNDGHCWMLSPGYDLKKTGADHIFCFDQCRKTSKNGKHDEARIALSDALRISPNDS